MWDLIVVLGQNTMILHKTHQFKRDPQLDLKMNDSWCVFNSPLSPEAFTSISMCLSVFNFPPHCPLKLIGVSFVTQITHFPLNTKHHS